MFCGGTENICITPPFIGEALLLMESDLYFLKIKAVCDSTYGLFLFVYELFNIRSESFSGSMLCELFVIQMSVCPKQTYRFRK